MLLLALVPLALVLTGLTVRFVVRIVYGPRGPAVGDWRHKCVMGMAWTLIGIGLTPMVLTLGASILGLFLVMLGMVTLVELVTGGRAAQRRVNAALLAEIIERPDGLEAGAALAAALPPGRVGDATRELFDMVGRGAPLRDALSVSRGAAPAEASSALAVGQALGDAPAALRLLLRCDSSSLAAVYRRVLEQLFYLSVVTLVMLSVLGFVLVYIVPEYDKILDEFSLQPPPMTQMLVATADWSMEFLSVAFMTLGLLLGLVVPGALIGYLCDQPVLRPLTDRIGWGLRVAEVQRQLGLAARRGGEFAAVLEEIAARHPSRVVARRARRAAAGIAAGDDWTNALRRARLLSSAEQSLVRAGVEAGNLPWVFDTLALRRERRLAYRASAAAQLLFPAALFLLAAAVGFVVIALFLPLVEMIREMA